MCTVIIYWTHLLTLACCYQTITANTPLTTMSTYIYTQTFNILHLQHSYDGATCVHICNVQQRALVRGKLQSQKS